MLAANGVKISVFVLKVSKNNMIFSFPLRSVYKELHADHETGAADNK